MKLARIQRKLNQAFAGMTKKEKAITIAAGAVGGTVVVGAVTYGIVSAFGSSWPGLRDSTCPIELYELVLGEHDVSEAVAERAWTYMPWVRYAASQFGVDPTLLAGLVHTESRWNPQAGSSAGAVGLTQFIPSTAKSRFQKLYAQGRWPFGKLSSSNDPQASGYFAREGVAEWIDRTDPRQALWMSASLLSSLLEDHNLDWALAAYNGGPAAANKPADQRPNETQNYVPSVLRHQRWYQELNAYCYGELA